MNRRGIDGSRFRDTSRRERTGSCFSFNVNFELYYYYYYYSSLRYYLSAALQRGRQSLSAVLLSWTILLTRFITRLATIRPFEGTIPPVFRVFAYTGNPVEYYYCYRLGGEYIGRNITTIVSERFLVLPPRGGKGGRRSGR